MISLPVRRMNDTLAGLIPHDVIFLSLAWPGPRRVKSNVEHESLNIVRPSARPTHQPPSTGPSATLSALTNTRGMPLYSARNPEYRLIGKPEIGIGKLDTFDGSQTGCNYLIFIHLYFGTDERRTSFSIISNLDL